MRLIIGLVVGNVMEKYRKNWCERWYKQALRLGTDIIVIDNSTDGTGEFFLNREKVIYYLKQSYNQRNMNRDYQTILNLTRIIHGDWILNIDIDEEYEPNITLDKLLYIINGNLEGKYYSSYKFILYDMREDEIHYSLLNGKDCRAVCKIFKVMPHLQYDLYNVHGTPVPENLEDGPILNIKIKHYGHWTKELREEKRKCYNTTMDRDLLEQNADWLKDEVETRELPEILWNMKWNTN